MRGTLKSRLEIKATKSSNGCWVWTAGTTKDGYGRIRGTDGELLLAHRASYLVHNGKLPEGMQVLHSCDNPPCINPEHLFLGTVTDNMRDMMKKGRGRFPQKGTNHHFAKLNQEKAFEIRWLAASGLSWNSLAKRYAVAKYNIQCVVKNITWRPALHD